MVDRAFINAERYNEEMHQQVLDIREETQSACNVFLLL